MKGNLRVTALGIASGAIMLAPAAHAFEMTDGVDVDIFIAQHAQSVEADSGAGEASDTSAGFGRTRFNLQFNVQFNDWVSGFVDLAEEPNDFGNDFGIQNDLTFLDFALLKAAGSPAAENNSLTLRLGQPVLTTFNYRGYSDGAQVQSNPLVGNSPFDIVGAQVGAQLIGEHQIGGVVESFGWDVMVANGSFGERFNGDQTNTLGARARLAFAGGFKIGAGYIVGDGDDPDLNSSAFLGDGDNINLSMPNGDQSTRNLHAAIIPGVDFDFAMVDAEYSNDAVTLRGWYGEGSDEYSFGSTVGGGSNVAERADEAEMSGFGLEGQVYLVPGTFYLAARYTEVTNDSDNVSGQDTLDRSQFGGGVWLAENTLLKAEYVRQSEEANSGGQIGEDWDGAVLEVSTRF